MSEPAAGDGERLSDWAPAHEREASPQNDGELWRCGGGGAGAAAHRAGGPPVGLEVPRTEEGEVGAAESDPAERLGVHRVREEATEATPVEPYRSRVASGPSVVALGGGHGLAVTLSAVSRYAGQVTAVVSVADDGGSSGRLRAFWPGPAPGDVRRCLLALAGSGADEQLWAEVFDYRFADGELAGHSLGNLVLVALSELTGDFAQATAEMGRLLGVRARVLPATLGAVDICAEIGALNGTGGPLVLEGQAKVTRSPAPVRRIWLRPSNPPAPDEVVSAISGADQVVLGPGSLFTSILATCGVPAIRDALAERAGGRVYVCNLTADFESAGFDADAHLAALEAHGVVVDTVVCDPTSEVGAPRRAPARVSTVEGRLANPDGRSHDPASLAGPLARLAALAGVVH